MKKIGVVIALFVAVLGFQSVFAEQARMEIKANSNVVDGAVTLNQTKRLSFLVYDGLPLEAGYAYEFGPIDLVKPNGERMVIQTARMQNGPIMHYSLYAKMLKLSPEGFSLEIGPIKRYNPNGTNEVLDFPKTSRTLQFIPPPSE